MMFLRIRRTSGPTNNMTGKATAHEVIHALNQMAKKPGASRPIASQVEIPETKKVIRQVSKNPKATGSDFFGRNGFIGRTLSADNSG